MEKVVVGWGCPKWESPCECGERAICYVSFDGMNMIPSCGKCAQDASKDLIADVLVKALAKRWEAEKNSK